MKMTKISVYTVAVGFFLAVTVPVALADERIIFFGNSYTYFNGGMENAVKALLEETLNTTVEAQRSTGNGAKLPRHLADLDGTNGDTAARQALITGNNTSWDLVVLQDQSAVPAYIYSDLWWESLGAGVELNNLIEPTGAVAMFLHTWGHQNGVGPSELFSNFPIMQTYLNVGYQKYQQAASTPQSFVAPAGIAFQLIYDETIAAGGTEASSPFSDLFSGDGSHPSQQGSYLSACVIYAAYTGLSVADLEWAPEGIGAERRDYLQNKADEAVFDDDTFAPSRWDLPDFVSPGDKLESTEPVVSPPAAPSKKPSTAPSVLSTPSPSISPSVVPTVAPSARPSVSPAADPSTSPSAAPYVVPSVAPSISPSARPSVSPLAAPITNPSTAPSFVPSVAPSIFPSAGPSVSPSVAPTKPSSAPSISFSAVPSDSSSVSPSAKPSVSPSVAPTTSPSAAPSLFPSVSLSAMPSVSPSASPSAAPSVMPSLFPSISPSAKPSVNPSAAPTTMPSTDPSVVPSVAPLARPSVSPSAVTFITNGNTGLLAAATATETSSAPRNAGMVTDMLLMAAIVLGVISM